MFFVSGRPPSIFFSNRVPPTKGSTEIPDNEKIHEPTRVEDRRDWIDAFHTGDFFVGDEKVTHVEIQHTILESWHGVHGVEYELSPRERKVVDSAVNVELGSGRAMILAKGTFAILMVEQLEPHPRSQREKKSAILLVEVPEQYREPDDEHEVIGYTFDVGAEVNTTSVTTKEIRPFESI